MNRFQVFVYLLPNYTNVLPAFSSPNLFSYDAIGIPPNLPSVGKHLLFDPILWILYLMLNDRVIFYYEARSILFALVYQDLLLLFRLPCVLYYVFDFSPLYELVGNVHFLNEWKMEEENVE